MKSNIFKKIVLVLMLVLIVLSVAACELKDPNQEDEAKFYINDNEYNQSLKNQATKEDAIDNVDKGITNLREYLNNASVATTGYYMGVQFNINTNNPETSKGGNFHLNIQAHLYTYPYLDGEGNLIYKYYDKRSNTYYDEQNEEGTRIKTSAEDIHNEVIKKSDIIIQWFDGVNNKMLIGLYYDGINNNSDDPGNILYVDIQGYKRYYEDFGDTVMYQQMIRLLTSLSVESLLTAGNIQDDAGVGQLRSIFEVVVNENYKVVINQPVKSTLFYNITADAVASAITDFYKKLFEPFEDKVDPLVLKYLGFKFSVMADAVVETISSDMQFFTELKKGDLGEKLTGAYLTFDGTATSDGDLYDYISDISFTYGAYPPEELQLDKDFYTKFENGKYELKGNLYVPMLNSNYDALIRTDMHRTERGPNSTNNVFAEFRDIANGDLMIGSYYRNERSYLDISGLEYLYGAIALEELGFPKVYDESLNLADSLSDLAIMTDDMIVSIVDGILSPKKNDKENYLLEYIMDKTESTEKSEDDIFSKNTVTLTMDMELIKHALEETGKGTYSTRGIINIIDSISPYSMDQIATMLGVASAEVMLDKTYFTFTLNVDTNEMTIKMFTDVGIEYGEPSTMIFQLDLIFTKFGEEVKIADINFDGFNPLGQIYTYSSTMDGNFMFSTAQEVDLSNLLGATIGDNSGLNTVYKLAPESGVTFTIDYDQYVLDHYNEDGEVIHKQGRSSFDMRMWVTGMDSEVLIKIASDDVAFSNEVYDNLPEREDELGYVWINIQCCYEKDGKTQRVPPVKIREDVFMASMQAYMNGTSISDDASKLGESDLNLSISTILFALMEDSYVVAQPEKIEITTSNETVQNLFRVRSLIGNIKTDVGFTERVEGLEYIKDTYLMYQVGSFEDLEFYSPYSEEAILHDEIGIKFYDDYMPNYDPLKYVFRITDDNRLQVYYEGKYYDPEDGRYYYENRYVIETTEVENAIIETRVPKRIKVKSGQTFINRDAIDTSDDTFFKNEKAENQDISKVRFRYNDTLRKIIKVEDGVYYYYSYQLDEFGSRIKVEIDPKYIKFEGEENEKVYIYWEGIREIIFYESGTSYYFYNDELAVFDENENYVYIENKTTRKFFFNYDKKSIEITNEGKSQYAPRIEGSLMGEVRRYYLIITSPNAVERSLVTGMNNFTYYSQEDEFNLVEEFDENGVKINEELIPIPLYVMEPAEDLPKKEETLVEVGAGEEIYSHIVGWDISWEDSDIEERLRGDMQVTTVTVAPNTMGQVTFPVRIIVSNREIVPSSTSGFSTVDIYITESEYITENVPVIDNATIDPYDFIFAKNNWFQDPINFNPTQISDEDFDQAFLEAEREFVSQYFSTYIFNIDFNADGSKLRELGVKEEYIKVNYSNAKSDGSIERFDWYLDKYPGSNANVESNISPEGLGPEYVYLHTYFRGQLIAFGIKVLQRTFVRIKYNEYDEYTPVDEEGITINGHYVANYYDEDSYVIPTQPILVFRDEAGVLYEKIFDFKYISGIDGDGNYIFDHYEINWSDPEITNIGSSGSYYNPEDDDPDMGMINRPFFISTETEDGIVVQRTSREDDISTSDINLRTVMCIYKKNVQQEIVSYSMIKGDNNDEWFSALELRSRVECPQQDVDTIDVEEIDQHNNNNNGIIDPDEKFVPTAMQYGSLPIGYYQIDPLNSDTKIIPRSFRLYFKDENGNRVASHMFNDIEWQNVDEDNKVITYDSLLKTYKFVLSTEEPLTTRIIAKVGNDISGYIDITLCIKVLSKDPRNIDFYYGSTNDEDNLMTDIEKISVDYGDLAYTSIGDNVNVKEDCKYVSYTYYVDTFQGFNLPTHLLATFGTSEINRTVAYETNWEEVNGNDPIYSPNSIVTLQTSIGDDEIQITIYLTIVIENNSVDRIDNISKLQSYYVKVGTNSDYEFVELENLYQSDNLSNQELGYYYKDDEGNEKYIVISTGSDDDIINDVMVDAGKIGLYKDNNGIKELDKQLYPYQFLEELYSEIDIIFKETQEIDRWNIDNFDYENTYVYLHDDSTNPMSIRLSSLNVINYTYDTANDKDEIKLTLSTNLDGIQYYLKVEGNDKLRIYPSNRMDEEDSKLVSLQALTNRLIMMDFAQDIKDYEVEYLSSEVDGQIVYSNYDEGTLLRNIFSRHNDKYIFYDNNDEVIMFENIKIKDFGEISYNELLYRLRYINNYCVTGITPSKITNKKIGITNIEGIFAVNDIVKNAIGMEFVPSNKYKIGLGQNDGSYDIKLKIIFEGGLRNEISSEEIIVNAYNTNGYAQYGEYGYILGEEILATVNAVSQDNRLEETKYLYGGANEKINKWYVISSDFDEVVAKTMINIIPQTVVYGNKDGNIVLSACTKEGFRITRTFAFNGVSSGITTYNSINSELEINNGLIFIDDIYNYYPLEDNFSNGNYLPHTIEIVTEEQHIRVSDVNWQIKESWNDGAHGDMYNMDYQGTYNEDTQTNSEIYLATTEILGWKSVNSDGTTTKHDVVSLALRISVDSAKISELPWSNSNPRLDTSRIEEEGEDVFIVDVDAFKDVNSSAIDGSNFILPSSINTKYINGVVHSFSDVVYTYRNKEVTFIPYNINGIDVTALANEIKIPVDYFLDNGQVNNRTIDLIVDLGLRQKLTIRFRFYDKTIENIMADIDFDDAYIRAQILESQELLKAEKKEEILELFNMTRIETNVEALITQARYMRERIELPTTRDIIYNVQETYKIYIWEALNDYYAENSEVIEDLNAILTGNEIVETWDKYKENNYDKIELLEYVEEIASDYNFAVDATNEVGETLEIRETKARAKILFDYYLSGKTILEKTEYELQKINVDLEVLSDLEDEAKGYLLRKAVFDSIVRSDLGEDDYKYEIDGQDIDITTNFTIQQCNNFAYDILENYFNEISNYTSYIMVIRNNSEDNTRVSETIANFYGNAFDTCYAEIIKKYMGREIVNFTYEDLFKETSDDLNDLNYAFLYRNMLEANIDVLDIIKNVYRIKELYSCGRITNEEKEASIKEMIIEKIDDAIAITKEEIDVNSGIIEIINEAFKVQIGAIEDNNDFYDKKQDSSIDDFIGNSLSTNKVDMRIRLKEIIKDSLDIFDYDNDIIHNLVLLQTEQAYENTSSLDNSIVAIKSNILLGIGASAALNTLISRSIESYNNNIYMEMNIGKEIRIAQGNVEKDSKYVMNPYSDYLYVPTKFIADFNEENGGFSYEFTTVFNNDTISNNLSYEGNENDDSYAYIKMWVDINEEKADDQEVIDKLDEILANKLDETFGEDNWDTYKTNNPAQGLLLNEIENMASDYYFEVDATNEIGETLEEREIKARAKILYGYYLSAYEITSKAEISGSTYYLNNYYMPKEYVLRLYQENKYTTLEGELYLDSIEYGQDIKLLIEVLDKKLEEDEINIYKEELVGENIQKVYYEEYIVTNPFVQTVDDLPKYVDVNGEKLEVIWKNVTISPAGNLSVEDNTIYGNIKNGQGQQVTLRLVVNSWIYTGVNKEVATDEFIRMDSNGYLNFYFSKYQEYSGDDRYQVVFDVDSINDEGERVTQTQRLIFYPEDSYLLVNSADDTLMSEVQARRNYILYWDNNIKNEIIDSEGSSQSLEANIYLGNKEGSYSINKLAKSTSTTTATKAKYFYEDLVVDKIQLTEVDSSNEYYDDVKDYLMAMSGETTIVVDPNSYLPDTASILLYESNVKYNHSEITTRLLWNNVSYESAIARLINFVMEAYPDTATNEIREKAKNILMNYDLGESEKDELIQKAMVYLNPNYLTLNEKDLEQLRLDACELLCINQVYDYENKYSYLTGGIYGNENVTLLIRIGQNSEVYVGSVKAKVVFSDYTPKDIYYLNAEGDYTKVTSIIDDENPETLYIKVRKDYWTDDDNSYDKEGSITPYNTNDNYVYKLLDIHNQPSQGDIFYEGYRLIKLENITYDNNGSTAISNSFEIDGRTYESNIIQLPVVSG